MRVLLQFLTVASLAACGAQDAPAPELPRDLVPADIGTPQYVPPRMACAPVLRDRERPGVQLILERSVIRTDTSRTRSFLQTTTVTTRAAVGEYRVMPDTTYGLQSRQRLRVNCASLTAEKVLEPRGSDASSTHG
jgi:hypothetical protein